MDVGDAARTSVRRLRRGWRFVLESTLAATLAWIISATVLHHPQPFFAPAAALLVLGAARGQRRWRAAEVVLGVAGGVLVADLVAALLGPGTTLTVCVVIALTSIVAVLLGASTVLLVQAMVSAVYVAVVSPPTSGLVPLRFIDALVGGLVALVVTQLLGPRDPVGPAVHAVTALFDEAAAIVRDTAQALRAHDEDAAIDALTRARNADTLVDRLRESAVGARESLWLVYRSTERTRQLGEIETASTQCDYLVRNLRVLDRAAVVLIRAGSPVPASMVQALESLAASLSLASAGYDDETLVADAHAAAVDAVTLASASIPDGLVLPQVTMVGQVRASAIDLLRATGVPDRDSIDRIDAALGG